MSGLLPPAHRLLSGLFSRRPLAGVTCHIDECSTQPGSALCWGSDEFSGISCLDSPFLRIFPGSAAGAERQLWGSGSLSPWSVRFCPLSKS